MTVAVDPGCVFCKIVDGAAPATIVEQGSRHLIIEPLAPHAPGHVLVMPLDHLRDVTEAPIRSGHILEYAARYGQSLGQDFQIVTSCGRAATQTVFHLHFHVIPRGTDDGLDPDWPWCRGMNYDAHMGMPT